MWIHYERLRNHNKAKHNKTVCIFLRIYCMRTVSNEDGKQCVWRSSYYGRTHTHMKPFRDELTKQNWLVMHWGRSVPCISLTKCVLYICVWLYVCFIIKHTSIAWWTASWAFQRWLVTHRLTIEETRYDMVISIHNGNDSEWRAYRNCTPSVRVPMVCNGHNGFRS